MDFLVFIILTQAVLSQGHLSLYQSPKISFKQLCSMYVSVSDGVVKDNFRENEISVPC